MNFDISQVVLTIVVVCLFLWRISYGKNNGLFAEATGLIAVFAAFASVYYIINITGSVLDQNYGVIIPKVGYLLVAFVVYKIMTAIGDAFKKMRDVPIFGALDRFLGAVLGAVEAAAIIYLIEYVTDLEIITGVMTVLMQLYACIYKVFNESFINN
ncbi:MAG: CvpA family protein [Butyrivibrio sp.]|uniref:CvpA family protein n=1 Tax=Butyrivibrio sp. TaxID=28121 RepID=UPI001B037491|nr:CvpA family protein [Butyrivibrio sp.]MBO6240016.1 CvpA family protein [Butyrivibrio sp.]